MHKVLSSLPSIFYPKVSAIEEITNLKKISMDALHEIITAYEMRVEKEKSSLKEVAFKESNETIIQTTHDVSSYESHEKESQFVSNVKKGL